MAGTESGFKAGWVYESHGSKWPEPDVSACLGVGGQGPRARHRTTKRDRDEGKLNKAGCGFRYHSLGSLASGSVKAQRCESEDPGRGLGLRAEVQGWE